MCHIKKLIFIEEQGYYYFCPRVYDSVSRNGKHKPNIDGYITLSKNYKYISTILPRKFKMSNRYASFLKMQYLQNYFKAILTQTTLTDEQIVRLENIRPPKNYFIPNKKGILLWVANLFSIKFIRFISSFISRWTSPPSTYSIRCSYAIVASRQTSSTCLHTSYIPNRREKEKIL